MKKVSLTIVCYDEESLAISKQMEKSLIAQEGLYTLTCGHIEDLTDEELEEVKDQVPPELLEED